MGHESLASTRPYLHADLELKQKALDRTAPPHTKTGRYTPPDKLLAFLESLRDYAALCGKGTALTSGGTAADREHRHNRAIGIIIVIPNSE